MNEVAENAATVREIAMLARRSSEARELILKWEDAPAGLPKSIPVKMTPGEYPDFKSVKALFEEYRQLPERKAGTAKVTTAKSFIDLVNRHKTDDTAIFANSDWRSPSVTAVIDYHARSSGGNPAFLKHRVAYAFPLSDPWQEWIGQNGKKMQQADFAQFLEDHIADLSSPNETEADYFQRTFGTKVAAPSELIQLSRGLQIFANTKVKNAVMLQTGEASILFEDEHRDANGNKLDIPGLFILSITPFFMGEVTRIPVRLRYRLVDGAIIWSFQIYRPDIAITERVRADLDIIARDTSLPVFEGFPENSAPN